ncbi:MAG: IS110 family transposase [Planctomycetaceae bacterium]|nr:IS110 family transposase [Planctomycetaceae bacterium]
MPVCAKNPLHIRLYARSLGTYAKTDKNDAKIIAQYALERKVDAMQTVSKQQLALKELLASRRRFVVQRVQLLNQLQTATQELVIKETQRLIEQTDTSIEHIEAAIDTIIADDAEWKAQSELLQSVPGIGKETARTLLIECPELGKGDADSVSCLVGVAPLNWDSGKMSGKRHIFGGRRSVRCALFNAVRAAIHFTKTDNVFKRMFERLRLAGKSYKSAMIAAAHKMLKIAHALLKSGTKWENKLTA